ncbi:MAG: hypothetical protein JO139_08610 [Alphaproteobacteria bacterium]|nr:hypothetical protein [Alphaproteobacteria bacterium]
MRSFAIITTSPNDLCAELRNRMPVVLGRTYPSVAMICWPVISRVGNVKNNDPSLI